ncbi:pilus (MSHA type) biogenesis protein MshL [Ferrimonas balearica]|uniref:pilus (MSHA type) biogenesis protein MshL n=1 Tax=Ferrimonas balearica TaxID=44012 RepID=UPI001C998739|nr:pilus (MSHA type) biogenesis protein MshL [Ferrimonas balearica]MBY5995493.1 pilus (MSHA type) biogenesis protein MshL [Ferrimonas balearica]
MGLTMHRAMALALCAGALAGCQNLPEQRPEPTQSKAALAQASEAAKPVAPPPALSPLLQQELEGGRSPAMTQPQAPRIDVAARGVDAQLFFASLVDDSPYSVAIHPGVSGKISLNLRKVTLEEVLDTVQDLYGYDIRRQGRVLQVYPAGMRSQTFPVNYLLMQRNGLSLTSVNAGRLTDDYDNGNSSNRNNNFSGNQSSNRNNRSDSGNRQSNSTNGTFIETRTETDFWGQLEKTLEKMIGNGEGRQVLTLPQAGLVSVRAFPHELREVESFLSQAQQNLERQVVLEARILEVQLSDGYQQGINWSEVTGSIGSTDISFGTSDGQFGNAVTDVIGGITGISFSGTDFNAVVTLLDTQGDVDTLSSPRVTAINNQKAVIKVGTDEYFVTNVSATTVASDTPITTPDVELTPFFSGIALDVTPQIGQSGEVLLHVHPSVTDISEQVKTINALNATLELPLAQSQIRESDTMIRAHSGDVVVIGGLMKTMAEQVESKVPVLGQIPILGELFTNRSQRNIKTELVILLRPTIVEAGTWQQQLQRSQNTLDDWYPSAN